MISFLQTILAFLFALGVIIVVHEAGHLLVAKAFGVRVLTFSVGFGKRLWGIQRGETEYRIAAVPLGGYVRLSGENPEEASTDPRDFLNKPRWQRILVYLAGPAMNVVLSVLIFAVLFMVGMDFPHLPDLPPVVGTVAPGSSAAQAGLQPGDLIVHINGEDAESWQKLLVTLVTSPERAVRLDVERQGRTFSAVITPARDPRNDSGDLAGILPPLRPQVTLVVPGGPAEAAGFRENDTIMQIDGRPILDSTEFVDLVGKSAGRRLIVEIEREGRPLELAVVPRQEGKVGRIGVGIGFFQRYPPLKAFSASVAYNIQIVRDTVSIIGKIFTREVSAKSALAGPIEIAKQSGTAARRSFKDLVQLMGLLSISIAFMNLLPIPILDGGQISILLVEESIRRDLPLKVKDVVSQVGFFMILALMAVVLFFDIVKNLPDGLRPGS